MIWDHTKAVEIVSNESYHSSIGPNNCRMFNDVFKYGIPTGIIHTTTYFLMVLCIVYIFM